MDFFTFPTAKFRILYVLVILSHDRREVVHFNVTEHSTAQWTAQQLVEAFPFDCAPRYLLRDRDAIYGEVVQRRIKSLGIDEVIIAPRSPWQNPFVERVIGSIRRECLNHVIVFNEQHLRRILRDYFSYYHTCRTHLSLNKDPPTPRCVGPTELGNIIGVAMCRRTSSSLRTRCRVIGFLLNRREQINDPINGRDNGYVDRFKYRES